MGEFRIGRKYAQHSYPESRRDTTVPYAGNFAQGPTDNTAISSGGTQIPWTVIASGAPAGVDIPITPKSSGRIRLVGQVVVDNISEGNATVSVQAQVDGVTISTPSSQTEFSTDITIDTVPFVLDLTLPVGVLANIQLLVTASGNDELELTAACSTLDISEIPAPTG